ncbi:Nuc-1 negative regulatory protein preg [Paramyrothecium foliicola]|nr:Nuc-1 negative regulatory protein preg [Paramyrothecium foliicola]
MLQTSPVLSSSPKSSSAASPFYHGPARYAQDSDRPSGSMPRRASSRSTSSSVRSMKSPPQPRVKRTGAPASLNLVVGSSAHPQDAPIDRQPATTSSSAATQQTSVPTIPAHPPPPARSESATMSDSQDSSEGPSAETNSVARPEGIASAAAPEPPSHVALSPNKRRSSPAPTIAQAIAVNGEIVGQESPPATNTKRHRPDEPSPRILPQKYELCAVEDMVELIAHMLAELIATNDAIRMSNGGLTRFHSRTAPGISVRDYLHRLAKHATLTPPLLLSMVYYIDRLCALYSEFTINTLTVHRFLITAATVAAKGLSDAFWNNTTYARVGGVRVAELKLLELEFLYRVDWRIVPNPEVLVAYYRGLVERTPGYTLEAGDSSPEDLSDEDEDAAEDDASDE